MCKCLIANNFYTGDSFVEFLLGGVGGIYVPGYIRT